MVISHVLLQLRTGDKLSMTLLTDRMNVLLVTIKVLLYRVAYTAKITDVLSTTVDLHLVSFYIKARAMWGTTVGAGERGERRG